MNAIPTTTTAAPIVAIDLGKYKSVACVYHAALGAMLTRRERGNVQPGEDRVSMGTVRDGFAMPALR